MDNKKAIEEYYYKLGAALIDEGATYFSIILSKNGKVITNYSTNPQWENIYQESGLWKSCHLIKASNILSQKSNNFIGIWDLFSPDNEVSVYLNEKRKEKKVSHGISFCLKNSNNILEVLSLAGRESDINFASQVLRNKAKINRYLVAYKEKFLK